MYMHTPTHSKRVRDKEQKTYTHIHIYAHIYTYMHKRICTRKDRFSERYTGIQCTAHLDNPLALLP